MRAYHGSSLRAIPERLGFSRPSVEAPAADPSYLPVMESRSSRRRQARLIERQAAAIVDLSVLCSRLFRQTADDADTIGELARAVNNAERGLGSLAASVAELRADLESLDRVVASRTEHLA